MMAVTAGLLLIAGSASADRYKDESGHGRDDYETSRYERYEEEHRDGEAFRGEYYEHYPRGERWSADVIWEGRRGSVGIRVQGGSEPHPPVGYHRSRPSTGYYEPNYRQPGPPHIPPGHLPPPGACRVWFYDRPPGHQPPPTSCHRAEHEAYRYGGVVVYGGPRH